MIWVAALMLVTTSAVQAHEAEKENAGQYVRCIAFYNLENLFDTIHDEGKNDYEYLPDGGMKWTAYKYENKVKNMAYAVSQLGTDYDPRGAACIGVAEVENIGCLKDLCAEANAKYGRRLKPILLEGPDRRGVDVGFLYDTVLFKPASVHGHELKAIGLSDGRRQTGEDTYHREPLAQPLRRRTLFPPRTRHGGDAVYAYLRLDLPERAESENNYHGRLER